MAIATERQKHFESEEQPLAPYSPFSTRNYGKSRNALASENNELPRKHAVFGNYRELSVSRRLDSLDRGFNSLPGHNLALTCAYVPQVKTMYDRNGPSHFF